MYTSAPLTFDDFYDESLRQNTRIYGESLGSVRTQQEMQLLEATFEKSLTANNVQPGPGSTGGDALKDYTLSNQLAVTERRMETEAPMWTKLKKKPHPYDRVEWVKLDSFGGDEFGSVLNTTLADGGLQATDPGLNRVSTPMGWFGVLGIATLMLTTQRTVGFNGIAQGNAEDTLGVSNLNNLVLDLDRHTLWGDNAINKFQPNGLIKQTRAANTGLRPTRIDLKGQPLTREKAQHIEAILREKGAMWKEFWMTGYGRADFITQFADAVRIGAGTTLTAGNRIEDYLITKWNGAEGQAKFYTNNHLRARRMPTQASPFAPAAPVTVAAAQAANAIGNAWGENLAAGPSTYFVVARGINGRSLPSAAAAISVVAGNAVTLTITVNDVTAIEFEIYAARNATGKGAGFLGRVGCFGLGAGATVTFKDDGEFVPGCDTGLILANGALETGEDEIQICQQFPITKIPLPRQLLALPFAYAAAMTPQDYTPGYNLILENVGRTAF